MTYSSFRDPEGHLIKLNNRIMRLIRESSVNDIATFLNTDSAKNFTKAEKLIKTYNIDELEIGIIKEQLGNDFFLDIHDEDLIVEHEKVDFPSYPYEWSSVMLYQAAKLTLDIANASLDEGFSIKDATPYNILFRNSKPVFIDLLSFELRDPADLIWLPHAQFSRTFILPLIACKYFDMGLSQIFITKRDGLEPEEVYSLCGVLQKMRSPFLAEVAIPTWLGRKQNNSNALYQKRQSKNPEQARFTLKHLFGKLHNCIEKLRPSIQEQSNWSEYMSTAEHYSESDFNIKKVFVEKVIREYTPSKVLDIGCNTGHFSALAAQNGAEVVAIDNDPVVVNRTWQLANTGNLDILPLVVDITRPTPAIGWRNEECQSFLSRAEQAFDLVMMLAVIHHMMCTERIPLDEIFSLAHQLTRDLLIIEFIPPDDPKFHQIARGRNHLFGHLTQDYFEKTCNQYFRILFSEKLEDGKRKMYLLKRKEKKV